MTLPNEIIDKIFLFSNSQSIIRWKDYQKMNKTTFLKKKDSILETAIESDNIIGVKYLLSSGYDTYKKYMFEIAVERGHLDIIQYFLQIDKTADARYAILESCYRGHLHTVKYLVDIGTGLPQHKALQTSSSIKGRLNVIKYLVDIDIPPSGFLRFNMTFGNLQVLKYLIEDCGAHPDKDTVYHVYDVDCDASLYLKNSGYKLEPVVFVRH
jgi:ribosomal protein L30/L7E